MNREQLYWGLNAVIPHAGIAADRANAVGLEYRNGHLYAFTCNRYSTAIARIADGADIHATLHVDEAVELARFVRPGRKLTETQELVYAQRPQELHIGWDEEADNRGVIPADSAVFDASADLPMRLDDLFDYLDRLRQSPPEWDELIVKPGLIEKFSKAARGEFDRYRILPRRVNGKWGAAIVTVGSDFIGAIAGMTYDEMGPATVADLLTLERNAA